jgi:hypothetical protein
VGLISQKFCGEANHLGGEDVGLKQYAAPKVSPQKVTKKEVCGSADDAAMKRKEECCSCTRFKHVCLLVLIYTTIAFSSCFVKRIMVCLVRLLPRKVKMIQATN